MEFTPLNNFFDHIYVITLERDAARQATIAESLTGLDYTFFFGVDKKDLTIDELVEQGIYNEAKAIELHRLDKPMNTGQIGCCWSHRLVYEDMLKNGFKRVLILEDHVIANKEGLAVVNDMIKELPENWELWYLDYYKNLRRSFATWSTQQWYHIKRWFGKTKLSHKAINNLYARKFSEHLFLAGSHQFSSAYAITQSAAKKLVALQTPIVFPSDDLLAHACTNLLVNGFVSCPKVFLPQGQVQDKKSRESYVEE